MGKGTVLAVVFVIATIVLAIAAVLKGNAYPVIALAMALVLGILAVIDRVMIRNKLTDASADEWGVISFGMTLLIITILIVVSVVISITVLFTGTLLVAAILAVIACLLLIVISWST